MHPRVIRVAFDCPSEHPEHASHLLLHPCPIIDSTACIMSNSGSQVAEIEAVYVVLQFLRSHGYDRTASVFEDEASARFHLGPAPSLPALREIIAQYVLSSRRTLGAALLASSIAPHKAAQLQHIFTAMADILGTSGSAPGSGSPGHAPPPLTSQPAVPAAPAALPAEHRAAGRKRARPVSYSQLHGVPTGTSYDSPEQSPARPQLPLDRAQQRRLQDIVSMLERDENLLNEVAQSVGSDGNLEAVIDMLMQRFVDAQSVADSQATSPPGHDDATVSGCDTSIDLSLPASDSQASYGDMPEQHSPAPRSPARARTSFARGPAQHGHSIPPESHTLLALHAEPTMMSVLEKPSDTLAGLLDANTAVGESIRSPAPPVRGHDLVPPLAPPTQASNAMSDHVYSSPTRASFVVPEPASTTPSRRSARSRTPVRASTGFSRAQHATHPSPSARGVLAEAAGPVSLHPPAPWVKLPSSRGVPYFHNRLNGMSVWDIRDVYKLKGMPVPAEVQRALAPDAPAEERAAAALRGKPSTLATSSSEERPVYDLPAMPATAASVASGSQAKTAAASIASSEPVASAAQIDIAALLEEEYGHI